MRHFQLLILTLGVVWLWTMSAHTAPPGRTWSTLVDFSWEYKQRPIIDRADEPCLQNFKVPGPGLLCWTFFQDPYHSTQVRLPESGVFSLSPSDGGAQLGYPAFYRYQEPKVEKDGVPVMWRSMGEVLKAQPAWTRFQPAGNYRCTLQLGCKIRMVIQFSPGLRQPGEQVEPPPSTPPTPTPGKTKKSYYEVGVIDAQGRRSGPIGPQWLIYSDGRMEGPGVWQGRWSQQSDGSWSVRITQKGAQDEFTIRRSADGFVAYKDGKPYRWGKLIRTE